MGKQKRPSGLACNIAEELKSYGFIIATTYKQRTKSGNAESPYMFGIIAPNPPIKRRFLWKTWNEDSMGNYIATLVLDKDELAEPDKKWLLNYYGHNETRELSSYLQEIAKEKEVEFKERQVGIFPMKEIPEWELPVYP